MDDHDPKVSVVAVSWNTAATLPVALDHLADALAATPHEVLVVDNGSSDDSVAVLSARDDVTLIALDGNTGFTRGANLGASRARGRYVLFLNPDIEAPPGSLDQLVAALESHPEAWAATPWFRNPDGTPQRFWRRAPTAWSVALWFAHRGRRVDRLLGRRVERRHHYGELPDPPPVGAIEGAGAACLLVRRDEFAAAGAFDERYFNFFQDTDLYRRMRRKGRVLLGVGSVEVGHGLGVTFRTLPPIDVHGQLLRALRQYLKGEPTLRRVAGELALRVEELGRPDLRARAR